MIIIWKADYEGADIQADLKRLDEINGKIQQKFGGRIEGPYFPQDASILYIFHVDRYEWLSQAGRVWFSEIGKLRLAFVPKTYEVAVTPKEFFG